MLVRHPVQHWLCRVVFPFETLLPVEASGPLSSLLDVVSSLGHLLPRAGRVLEHLPEFLHELKIATLLDTPDFPQVGAWSWPRGRCGFAVSVCLLLCLPFSSTV